jgi:hypothetical protein
VDSLNATYRSDEEPPTEQHGANYFAGELL